MQENNSQQSGQAQVPGQQILRKFSAPKKKTLLLPIIAALAVILSGVGTGWFLSGSSLTKKSTGPQGVAAPGAKESTTEAGLQDEATFRDSAEGVLEVGGIEGEGTHHLVRDGGPSKFVYLTSTVIDLDSFAGKKVKVWGETISARKAGWLMDVGKIKIIE